MKKDELFVPVGSKLKVAFQNSYTQEDPKIIEGIYKGCTMHNGIPHMVLDGYGKEIMSVDLGEGERLYIPYMRIYYFELIEKGTVEEKSETSGDYQ